MSSIIYRNQTIKAEPSGSGFLSSVNNHVLAETFPTAEAAIEFGKRYADTLPADFENSWRYVLRYWWRALTTR